MSNRTFIDSNFSLVKRMVHLFGAFSVGETGTPTLLKWNYPTFGGGVNARTYTAAPTSTLTPAAGNYPLQYQAGSEGIRSVARTATGLWTVTLQDNYQRMVGLTGFTRVAGGAAKIVGFNENTTITNMASGGGSVIGVSLISATTALADPTSGDVVLLTFILADATEP